MVLRLPGFPQREQQTATQAGPQPGPDPAWARFSRIVADAEEAAGAVRRVSVSAYKPDITAYRVLGREPLRELLNDTGPRERNRHNRSVYVASLNRWRGKPQSSFTRLPVVGEIAAGQYDVTVAFQEYDCLDYEGGV